MYIADNTYSKEEILAMEVRILHTLEFNLQFTSSYRFLERLAMVAQADSKVWNMARYLIELILIEQCMLKYPPSMIAASAMLLAIRLIWRTAATGG